MRELSHPDGYTAAEQVAVDEAGPHAEITAARLAVDARYLTDGSRLYRNLGRLDGAHEMIGLENCMSLEVMLVPCNELRDGHLRAVHAEAVA